MVKEAVFAVVGLVVLGVLVALAVLVARLGARVRRVKKQDGGAVSRSVATVQGWAARELKALRGQVTAIHANPAPSIVPRATSSAAVRPRASTRPTTPPPRPSRGEIVNPWGG